MSFHRSIERTARKDHKCDLCCKTIEKGKKYIEFAGKYDDFYSGKHHLNCEKLIIAYCKKNNEDEYDSDTVLDWVCDEGCSGCDNQDNCEVNPHSCERVIKIILG